MSLGFPIRFISLKLISIEENKTESLGTIDTCTYEKGKISAKPSIGLSPKQIDKGCVIFNINKVTDIFLFSQSLQSVLCTLDIALEALNATVMRCCMVDL